MNIPFYQLCQNQSYINRYVMNEANKDRKFSMATVFTMDDCSSNMDSVVERGMKKFLIVRS